MYTPGETIAAIATPPGEGGVAIIRISGPQALRIAKKVFSRDPTTFKSHALHFGQVVDEHGATLDEALLTCMRGPRSYTGEDTVEIHCHGGSLITKRVLEAVLCAGARSALPGEFTFKAFMNGKIDLAQAEAVQTLIGAKNELALHQAEHQLQGRLSKKITSFQEELTEIAAILEASVDFPEEGLEFATTEKVLFSLTRSLEKMEELEATYDEGKLLCDGLTCCLIGAPNVGKSSLLNALTGKERAIVTDIPGTTRDILEVPLKLGSFHFTFLDTAGIRETEERVEREGIRRSKLAMEEADLILLLLDATRGIEEDDRALLTAAPPDKTLYLWNKIDAKEALPPYPDSIPLSAKEGIGLDTLKSAIASFIWKKGPPSKEEVIITTLRHKEALQGAIAALKAVIRGLKEGASPEFPASDMRRALHELAKILGVDVSEEILSAIFSKFCVGK